MLLGSGLWFSWLKYVDQFANPRGLSSLVRLLMLGEAAFGADA